MEILKDYQKYRWFYTSSDKLVVGGKSAVQNDDLLKKLKQAKQEFIVMHTASPGSPFSVILSSIKEVSPQDIKECAILTGCFSRAWKERKKKAKIHIFRLSQVYKTKTMAPGTWGVKPPITEKTVPLELVLTRQNGILRAVPESAAKNTSLLLRVQPGKTDKSQMLLKIQAETSESLKQDEVLSALPPGGILIKSIKQSK